MAIPLKIPSNFKDWDTLTSSLALALGAFILPVVPTHR